MKWFKGSNTWITWLVAGTAAVATMAFSSWYRYVREPSSRTPPRRPDPPPVSPKPSTPAGRSEAPAESSAADAPPADEPAPSADEPTAPDAAASEVDYASWTKAELYEQAKTWDIHGRSTMNKAELIEALRAHRAEA